MNKNRQKKTLKKKRRQCKKNIRKDQITKKK